MNPTSTQHPPPGRDGAIPQFYIRYWFAAFGYDLLYIDVFVSLPSPPTLQEASDIVNNALRVAGWIGINLQHTSPSAFGPLYREHQGEIWDWETGVQQPVIPVKPGKALVRKYRVRNVASGFPHLPKAEERIVDRGELL